VKLPYEIWLAPRARRELAVARAWWRLHRPAAPDAISRAMRAARKTLSRFPEAGAVADDPTLEARGLRQLLLASIDYHVYYRILHEDRRVEIVTIWHGSRRPPRL